MYDIHIVMSPASKCNTVLHLCWLTGFFLYLLMRWKIESISAEFTKLVTFSAICFVCQFLCSFSKVYGIPTKVRKVGGTFMFYLLD